MDRPVLERQVGNLAKSCMELRLDLAAENSFMELIPHAQHCCAALQTDRDRVGRLRHLNPNDPFADEVRPEKLVNTSLREARSRVYTVDLEDHEWGSLSVKHAQADGALGLVVLLDV